MVLQTLSHRIVARYASHPFRLVKFVGKSILWYHVFITHLYNVEGTFGASMLPTMSVMGDHVLISKLHRRGRDMKVGDLVAFQSVVAPNELAIKRIVAMEGDYVLRDTPDPENRASDMMIQIPEGHCWVVGDNLPFSRDSRHYGPLPMALIRGKVLARVLPLSEMQWFEEGLRPELD